MHSLFLPIDLQIHRGINSGSVTRSGCLVHFFFCMTKKEMNQRKKSPADRKKAKNQSMFS